MPFTTLETTNFPLYAVNTLDCEHFLIAGGGGSAKTGVPNAMVCIHLSCSPLSKHSITGSNCCILQPGYSIY